MILVKNAKIRNIKMTMNNFDVVFGTYFPELKASPLIVSPSRAKGPRGPERGPKKLTPFHQETSWGRVREEELELRQTQQREQRQFQEVNLDGGGPEVTAIRT